MESDQIGRTTAQAQTRRPRDHHAFYYHAMRP